MAVTEQDVDFNLLSNLLRLGLTAMPRTICVRNFVISQEDIDDRGRAKLGSGWLCAQDRKRSSQGQG
jgi:hypothetical protein